MINDISQATGIKAGGFITNESSSTDLSHASLVATVMQRNRFVGFFHFKVHDNTADLL